MGDLADDDRSHDMGIVVEYAHRAGKPLWLPPPAFKWNYARFGNNTLAPNPDETIDMLLTSRTPQTKASIVGRLMAPPSQ